MNEYAFGWLQTQRKESSPLIAKAKQQLKNAIHTISKKFEQTLDTEIQQYIEEHNVLIPDYSFERRAVNLLDIDSFDMDKIEWKNLDDIQAPHIEGYTPTNNKPMDAGHWTAVFTYKRDLGDFNERLQNEDVSAKINESLYVLKILTPTRGAVEQGVNRGYRPAQIMKNEQLNNNNSYDNVIWNDLIKLDNGHVGIIEQFVPTTVLDNLRPIDSNGKRAQHTRMLTENEKKHFVDQYMRAFTTMHIKIKSPHGDPWYSNMGLTEDATLKLFDFGQVSSLHRKMKGDMSDIGSVIMMAPESHTTEPTLRSDVYALGLLILDLYNGSMPFEKELRQISSSGVNPKGFKSQIERKKHDKEISKYLKALPKELRPVIKTAVSYYDRDRHENAQVMNNAIQEAYRKQVFKQYGKDIWRKWSKPLMGGLVLAGLMTAIVYRSENFEPKELKVPTQLQLNLGGTVADKLFYEIPEDVAKNLPKTAKGLMMNIDPDYSMIKGAENLHMYTFLKAYQLTFTQEGWGMMSNESMFNNWAKYRMEKYGGMYLEHMSKKQRIFEAALVNTKIALSGATYEDSLGQHLDIPKMCTIARIGFDTFYKASHQNDIKNFNQYIAAKNKEGEYLIDEDEQEFIKIWIAQIQNSPTFRTYTMSDFKSIAINNNTYDGTSSDLHESK